MKDSITVFFMVSSFNMKLEKIPRFVGVSNVMVEVDERVVVVVVVVGS